MRKRDRQATLNRKPPNSRLAEKLSIQGRPSVVRIGLEGLQVHFWKGSEAGSGGRHSRVLPGFPVRRCWLRRRFRLRSFSRRTGPVRWILKARTERPIASSNPSEPRRRIRISTQCSRLSIADSDGLVWIERRSANFGPGPCGSGLRAARAAPQLPGSRNCFITQHRGAQEVRCAGAGDARSEWRLSCPQL